MSVYEGIPHDVKIENRNDRPKGCYVYTNKDDKVNYGVWFNDPPNNIGSSYDYSQPVCKILNCKFMRGKCFYGNFATSIYFREII